MFVEITDVILEDYVITIEGIDVEDRVHFWAERRSDVYSAYSTRIFMYDTRDKACMTHFYSWIKEQKSCRGSSTWGEALQRLIGTITDISAKYMVLD